MTAKKDDIQDDLYGLIAEFDCPDALKKAGAQVYFEGYRRIEAYSPFPIHGLAEAVGMTKTRLPLIVLIGGMLGLAAGFLMQYYASVISYPYNIGGRPLMSWPSFIPVTFELGVLGAAFSAVLGMLGLNGLPMPYHPVFNTENFEKATKDGFFLMIRTVDPEFDEPKTRKLLESLKPMKISEVRP